MSQSPNLGAVDLRKLRRYYGGQLLLGRWRYWRCFWDVMLAKPAKG